MYLKNGQQGRNNRCLYFFYEGFWHSTTQTTHSGNWKTTEL